MDTPRVATSVKLVRMQSDAVFANEGSGNGNGGGQGQGQGQGQGNGGGQGQGQALGPGDVVAGRRFQLWLQVGPHSVMRTISIPTLYLRPQVRTFYVHHHVSPHFIPLTLSGLRSLSISLHNHFISHHRSLPNLALPRRL